YFGMQQVAVESVDDIDNLRRRSTIMRFVSAFAILALLSVGATVHAAAPTRSPERTGKIVKIAAPTDAEKKDGILATITVKDKDAKFLVQITADTILFISKGKDGDVGKVGDFKVGDPVSVWFKKDDSGKQRTEQLMAFRAGVPDLPPVPPSN